MSFSPERVSPVPLPTALPAPRTVRVVGVIVALQGLVALVFALAVLATAFGTKTGAGNLFGEFGYYLVLSAGILAVAGGLLLGRRWSRTPAALLQVLLIAVAWYAIGSKLVVPAIITVVLGVAALVLLFTARARAWAVTDPEQGDGDPR
jgi:hypothetical protein